MPDGQIIRIGSQRFRCTEALFDPSLIGKESNGIHKLLFSAVSDCDIDLRRDLYQNIVLSGGNTMLSGLEQRLSNEMDKLTPSSTGIHIEAPTNRNHSVWIGGSVLSSLPNFKESWITFDEYSQSGSSIVHRKCL